MSLPVVLPTSCCPVPGPGPGEVPPLRCRSRCPPWPGSVAPGGVRQPLPCPLYGRALFALGLLQIALGFSIVSLSFGALSVTESPNVRNSCPFWAGSSVILSGILGLTTWKRPMLLLVNLFILLSVVCVLLNLAGFVLSCQSAQFVSSIVDCQLVKVMEGKDCFCCEGSQATRCTDKKEILILYPVLSVSCDTVRLVLKDLLFAICVLNALTTTVCVVAAALQYLQIFASRRPRMIEAQVPPEESEEPNHLPDPDEFVPPIPPPPYFSTFCSYTPRINPRILSNDVIPLTHIYGTRMKGIEVFCPVDPPPPYEVVVSNRNNEQGSNLLVSEMMDGASERIRPHMATEDNTSPSCSLTDTLQLCIVHPPRSRNSETACEKSSSSSLKRSNSDPLLQDLVTEDAVVSCEAATQTEERPEVKDVTLRKGSRSRAARVRPRSLVDYNSYRDTKLLVARFLEQSSCSMTPEVQELVENIKSVLQSDEEHMDEAVASANIIDKVITGSEHNIPGLETPQSRRHAQLLHLHSCGDLSTFTTTAEAQTEDRSEHKPNQERPHSLTGGAQETIL